MPVWNCSMAAIVGGQPNLLSMSQSRSRLTVLNTFVRSMKAVYIS